MNGYLAFGLHGTWNALEHIRCLLRTGGYAEQLVRADDWSKAALIVGPRAAEFWKILLNSDAPSWTRWRLAPHQRISRRWGMHVLATKSGLVRTLSAHWSPKPCPFLPETHVWASLRASDGWEAQVRSRPAWIIKTNAHRGDGILQVTSEELVRAAGGQQATERRRGRALLRPRAARPAAATLLGNGQALVQQVISSPALVGGHKFSIRLYAVVTSATPLRVYVHAEGFALFASSPFNATSDDRNSVLTNAHVNAHAARSAAAAAASADFAAAREADKELARSLGLGLPPQTMRWPLASLIRFLEARGPRACRFMPTAVGEVGEVGEGLRPPTQPPTSAATSHLLRDLHRIVLSSMVAARGQLDEAQRAALSALGLSGPHEFATAFELTAFDVLLDDFCRPWLLEINTTPSLKAEEPGGLSSDAVAKALMAEPAEPAEDRAGAVALGAARLAPSAAPRMSGELPSKMRMLRDMLSMVRPLIRAALSSAQLRPRPHSTAPLPRKWKYSYIQTRACAVQVDALPELDMPEDVLLTLLSRNGGAVGTVAAEGGRAVSAADERCEWHWRLGGCVHCPRWSEVVELWRLASERRRARNFTPLAPSTDPEWSRLAEEDVKEDAAPRQAGSTAGSHDGSQSVQGGRPTAHALQAAWVALEGDEARRRPEGGEAWERCHAQSVDHEACVAAKWRAMLC
jgi:hypothetical protein